MFSDIVKQQGWSPWRLKQINQAVFKQFIGDWSQATTLPREIIEYLQEHVPLSTLREVKKQVNKKNDTVKILFELDDGNRIETVLMKHKGRNTVCVSSQVGCPVGCAFCATGKLGLTRNLTAREIIDQILWMARELNNVGATHQSPIRKRIDNVVFMGMGEPMLNLENVSRTIEILTDDTLLALGKRKITVSTSGYIDPLKKFLARFPNISLAISLHAPDQKTRELIMPTVAKANPLNKLIDTACDYSQKTKRRISFEYILLEGINDSLDQAKKLAELFTGKWKKPAGKDSATNETKHFLYHVNLIPYNPNENCTLAIKNLVLKKPNSYRVNRFKDELNRLKIPVSVRVVMGDDIAAACGQLAGG